MGTQRREGRSFTNAFLSWPTFMYHLSCARQCRGISRFTVLHFTAFHRYSIFFFFFLQLKVYGNSVSSKSIHVIFPRLFAFSKTVCFCGVFVLCLGNSFIISDFFFSSSFLNFRSFYYYICHGDL